MNEIQKKLIKKFLQSEQFDAVAAFYEDYLVKVRGRNVIGNTNGETLKLTLMREGGIMAIQEFFSNLDQEIYD